MAKRAGAGLLGVVLGALLAGCAVPVLPVPPPGVSASYLRCEPADCPGGGVRVQLVVSARAGALVLAEDLTTRLPDGTSYEVAAMVPGSASGDGGSSVGTVTLSFDPRVDSMLRRTFCRVGDVLQVRQLVPLESGNYQPSDAVMVTVQAAP